jgi:alcohol dehydrogenase class IV
MREFVYSMNPARVIFGPGKLAELGGEVARLGIRRALVVSTPGQADQAVALREQLGSSGAAIFTEAAMHTPVAVTERAMAVVADHAVDGIVAIGGGSTIGLSKAIALRTDLPQLVIPTTYAGSEMTPILGETSNGEKITQSTHKVLPEVVIYDVDLTRDMPMGLTGASAINAIAHAVEALYARDRNPIISLAAAEGIGALARALAKLVSEPASRKARSDALYGAWLCGFCLGAVGMALHHKLCHTLGGMFGLPHAEMHAIVLPHALAYNAPAVPEAMAALRPALGGDDPAVALYRLREAAGLPGSLREIGMPQAGIAAAAERAMANSYWNPRPLECNAIRDCLAHAWAGDTPGTTG